MRPRGCLLALLVVVGASHASQGRNGQARADFQSALQDRSSSPYYVKIRLTDGLNGNEFDTCVTANLLMGAVHIEWNLPYSEEGSVAAERLAASRPTHSFSFNRPASLENMPWHPSPVELSAAAQLVASTPGSLHDALERGEFHRYYSGHVRARHRMAALACALIDRGFRPRVAHRSGQLYVER